MISASEMVRKEQGKRVFVFGGSACWHIIIRLIWKRRVMVKVATYIRGWEGPRWYDATRILTWLNEEASIEELRQIHWGGAGKKKFLMGEVNFAICAVAIPLSEAEAMQAIREYKELGKHYS